MRIDEKVWFWVGGEGLRFHADKRAAYGEEKASKNKFSQVGGGGGVI